MPKHESTPPPPAASKGLDLGDLINNISLSNNTRKQATTSFPAIAQNSTRIKTEYAPLGDPGRTVLEGLAPPTAFQTVVDPTMVPVRQTTYKTSKHKSTRPPPAANSGLNLNNVLNDSPSKHTHRQATTSFPATAQQSTRIKTEHAPLGDPRRTVLEGVAVPTAYQTVVDPTVVPGTRLRGMVPPSQGAGYGAHTPSIISTAPSIKSAATHFRGMVPPSTGAGYPAHTPSMISAAPSIKSAAPNWARSVLTKPEDQEMASRQTAFATLSPAEQAKQNTWAQSIIGRSIQCPQGFDWERHHKKSGYQCAGKHHFVSDDLLAEGKGGVMLVPAGGRGDIERCWGPYYPDPRKPERLVYGGSGNRSINSLFGPDWTEPKTETWHWPKLWQIFKDLQGPPGNEADYPLLEHKLALFFLMPVGIRSSSHGATLVLRGDPADDPFGGWQNRGAGWGPGWGAGSGISYAGLLRSPSQIHTDDLGSQSHISRGSSKKKRSSKKSKGLGAALSRFSK